MSRTAVLRKAFVAGMRAGSFRPEGRMFALEGDQVVWRARIDNRGWAGSAVEADLAVSGAALQLDVAASIFMETMPWAQSLEVREALYSENSIDDETRHERLTECVRQFASALSQLDSIEKVRAAVDSDVLRNGWIHPLLRSAAC